MQFSFILALLTSVVVSVSAQGYPDCAAICITQADTGGCTSNACLCQNSAFVKSTGDCFIAKCSGDDQKAAFSAAQELCREAGVTSTSDFGSATAQGQGSNTNTGTGTGTTASSQQTSPPAQTSNDKNAALSSRMNVNLLGGIVGLGAGLVMLRL